MERLEMIKKNRESVFGSFTLAADIEWLIEKVERMEVYEKLSERAWNDVDTLKEENSRLKETLTFYADETRYQDYDEWSPGTSDVMSDHGRKAKSALEETK